MTRASQELFAGFGEERAPLLHQGLQQDMGTMGASLPEATTYLFAATSHTLAMSKVISALTCTRQGDSFHF